MVGDQIENNRGKHGPASHASEEMLVQERQMRAAIREELGIFFREGDHRARLDRILAKAPTVFGDISFFITKVGRGARIDGPTGALRLSQAHSKAVSDLTKRYFDIPSRTGTGELWWRGEQNPVVAGFVVTLPRPTVQAERQHFAKEVRSRYLQKFERVRQEKRRSKALIRDFMAKKLKGSLRHSRGGRGGQARQTRCWRPCQRKLRLQRCSPARTTELREFVLVVLDDAFEDKYEKILQGLALKGLEGEEVEIWPLSRTREAAFRDRHGHDTAFEVNKLHKKHPRKKRYMSVDTYHRMLESEKLGELVFLLGDIGAKAVVFNRAVFDKVRTELDRSADANVPVATPVDVGARVGARRGASSSSTVSQQMSLTWAEPRFQPHDHNPARWFYQKGHMPTQVTELAGRIVTQGVDMDEHVLAFATKDEHEHLSGLQTELCSIIGVAVNSERADLREFDYSFNVKFFDKSAFEGLELWRVDNVPLREARFSLSSLASMRAAHWKDKYQYREDVMFFDGKVETVETWTKSYSEATWGEWLRAQASSNVMRVPLVLYGPNGEDNSVALFTWELAVRSGPHSFFAEWQNRIMSASDRPRDAYETFMQNIRFDPDGSVTEFSDVVRGVRDDKVYNQLREKDMVKLLICDTPDAKDVNRDKNGLKFPFGLRLLVLNAARMARLAKAINNPSGAVSQDHTNELAHVEAMLGKVRDEVDEDAPVRRYPPVACLLMACDDIPEGDDEPTVDDVKDFVCTHFKIGSVLPMRTFRAPDDGDVARYKTDREFRNAHNDRFEAISSSALRAMQRIFNIVVNHEFNSWKRRAG
ncbi:Uncharacterized protein SCF082_LOCUS41172 [Durusdinium trenchii]|uniref:Uncharacterized protein n=1 Tax=Durusdinium trenchii TaxID=1381693 RepID=A0ABP0QJ88_9DINO